MKRCFIFLMAALCFLCGCSAGNDQDSSGESQSQVITITNTAYDSCREFFSAYNEMFQNYWLEETGDSVTINMNHGGSVSQAETQKQDRDADVVTLACAEDVDTLQEAGMIQEGWEEEYDQGSVPFTSAIVFLVRKGNPEEIYDWGDLIQEGLDVITPDPDSSGGGRWNFLGAVAYAKQREHSDSQSIRLYLKKLYQNVLVMDSTSRDAVTTFVERGQGDVLITWENEAYLTMEEYPQDYQVVMPKTTVVASPAVAVVDSVAADNDTKQVAEAYVEYLFSDEAQRLAGESYLRPSNETIFEEFEEQFTDAVTTLTIDNFGGWTKAHKKYFSSGGLFHKVYQDNE